MLALIRRITYYAIPTLSLLYMATVLQNVVRDLLLRVGFTDVLTLGGLLDLISALPIFSSVQADVVVCLAGVGGWLLVRHDRVASYDGKSNAVRAFFLAALAAGLGLRVLVSLLVIVFNADTLAQDNLPIAAPLAGALAWSVAVALVLLEWYAGGWSFDDAGERIAMFFAHLGQWVLLIFNIWSIATLVQSALQQVTAPLPLCSPELNIPSQLMAFILRATAQCTDTPPPVGAALTAVACALTFAIYARWGARYQNTAISNLDAIVGSGLAAFFITLNSVLGIRLLLDLVTSQTGASLPRSLLSSSGSVAIDSYPFIGPLVAGLCVLAFYFWREKRRETRANDSSGLLYGLMTLSFPLGAVFFVGACALVGDVFLALAHNLGLTESSVTLNDWLFGLMLFIPGLLFGSLLWLELHLLLRGSRKGYWPLPLRIYGTVFLAGTLGAASISLLVFIALVGTALLRTPIDPTNSFAPRMLAITLVTGSFVPYYRDLRRRW